MRLRRDAERFCTGWRDRQHEKSLTQPRLDCASQYFYCIAPKSLYISHINGCGVSGVRMKPRLRCHPSADRVRAQSRAMPDESPHSQKDHSMTEAYETTKSKSKTAPAAFEMPKFELPNFEMPKMEIPAAFREIAEKSVSQAKETYEKLKSAAEEATDVLEDTYATATKGVSDYGLKVIESARENTNAAFDFATRLMTVKSLAEGVELSTAHSRKQL